MAEVIGVVSGAITFATVLVQIGKTIITLKECYHDLRDAPDDLRKLVQQIELFGKILVNVEDDLSRNPNPGLENSEAALQSLAYCKEAANELDTVCNDIVRDVKSPGRLRRSFKSVKIVIQKGKIEKHMDHLRNVIQLLMWSEQCYNRALTQAHIQAQSQLIIETMVKLDIARSSSENSKITTTREGAESSANNTKSIVVSQDKGLKFAQNSSYRWRLSLPRWITSEVLEVAAMKAPGGWNWYLRAYGVIPRDAKTAWLVMKGDIEGLQDLFNSGQASPFDRIDSSNGDSLLHMVGRKNRTKMISFLLDQGADLSCSDHLPLGSRFLYRQITTIELESLVPSMRVMFRHIDLGYQSAEEWAVSVLSKFEGTSEEFSFLQRHVCPSFYQLSKQIRLRVALGIAGCWTYRYINNSTPEVVRIVLKMDILEPGDFKFSQEMHSTLIHSAARHIGSCQQAIQKLSDVHEYKSGIDGWIGLCHDFLSVGIDIHYIINGRTPLMSCVEGWFSYWSPFAANSVQLWLEQLEAVGVDLSEYGKAEEFIWKNQTIQRQFQVWSGIPDVSETLRVIGFTYGPSPKDWHIWLSDPSDSYIGEFWNMIAQPVEVMPGS